MSSPIKVMGNSACTHFAAEVHVQCARASQGNVVTPPHWSLDNPEGRVALRQSRESDVQFEPREDRPETVVIRPAIACACDCRARTAPRQ